MSAPRGYATWLIALVAATSVVTFGLNTWVNPWRVTTLPWSSKKADPYRDISSQIRTAKAGMVRSATHLKVAFFGSSRVANAMNPSDSHWPRDGVLNLGCSGGFIYESVGMFQYTMARQPLELAFLGVDPGDLTSDLDTRPMGDFYTSPLTGSGDVNRELRYLIGVSTAEESVETLKRFSHGELPQYDERGMRVRSRKPPGRPQISFIREQIAGEAEFGLLATGRDGAEIRGEKIRLLEELLNDSRAHGIRVLLYFHPTHALRHLRASDADDPPILFENERRALVDVVERVNAKPFGGPLVELWDFQHAHPLNCDPLPVGDGDMDHWTDLEHYTVEVGGIMQARMMGWELDENVDYGRKLTADALGSWLEEVRASYGAYVRGAGSPDIAWKEELIGSAARKN